ncbi:MAG: hypothetical protein IKJ54_05315, partial [Anaerotignum sp.]|nr:hypothetical protein [Anaerotignum sp.]
MRKCLFIILFLLLTGCRAEGNMPEQEQAGVIGEDMPISREMAAKTIALAFYSNEELAGLDIKLDFSDVSPDDWA